VKQELWPLEDLVYVWKRMMNLGRYTLLLLTFLGVPGW
jgi:hypothetical protein